MNINNIYEFIMLNFNIRSICLILQILYATYITYVHIFISV